MVQGQSAVAVTAWIANFLNRNSLKTVVSTCKVWKRSAGQKEVESWLTRKDSKESFHRKQQRPRNVEPEINQRRLKFHRVMARTNAQFEDQQELKDQPPHNMALKMYSPGTLVCVTNWIIADKMFASGSLAFSGIWFRGLFLFFLHKQGWFFQTVGFHAENK